MRHLIFLKSSLFYTRHYVYLEVLLVNNINSMSLVAPKFHLLYFIEYNLQFNFHLVYDYFKIKVKFQSIK